MNLAKKITVILCIIIILLNIVMFNVNVYQAKPYAEFENKSYSLLELIDNRDPYFFNLTPGDAESDNNKCKEIVNMLNKSTYSPLSKKDALKVIKKENRNNRIIDCTWNSFYLISASELKEVLPNTNYVVDSITLINDDEIYLLIQCSSYNQDIIKKLQTNHISGYNSLMGFNKVNSQNNKLSFFVFKADNPDNLKEIISLKQEIPKERFVSFNSFISSYRNDVAYGFLGYTIYFSPSIFAGIILVLFIVKKSLKKTGPGNLS